MSKSYYDYWVAWWIGELPYALTVKEDTVEETEETDVN